MNPNACVAGHSIGISAFVSFEASLDSTARLHFHIKECMNNCMNGHTHTQMHMGVLGGTHVCSWSSAHGEC